MNVVSALFSIRPGCVPPAKTAVLQSLREPYSPAGLLGAFLAEVGEVNTLCCFFTSDPACAALTDIDLWLRHIYQDPDADKLRHVECVIHQSPSPNVAWEGLWQPGVVSVVQRVFDRSPIYPEAREVMLHSLTGRHSMISLLTPTSSHDEALALCKTSTLDTDIPLRDSVLWLPLKTYPNGDKS